MVLAVLAVLDRRFSLFSIPPFPFPVSISRLGDYFLDFIFLLFQVFRLVFHMISDLSWVCLGFSGFSREAVVCLVEFVCESLINGDS